MTLCSEHVTALTRLQETGRGRRDYDKGADDPVEQAILKYYNANTNSSLKSLAILSDLTTQTLLSVTYLLE